MSVRIAVAGAGLIGRRHIELIGGSEDATLAAIVDPSPVAANLAASLSVPYFGELDNCLREARPDGVIVATPNALHVPQALQCVAQGVAILVEKPVADTLEAGLALADASEKAGVPVLVGHHRRHSPILAQARALITSGELGRIVAVNASAMFYKPDRYFEEGPWRTEKGGGPILINLIHEIDNLRFLCGDIVEVSAMASNAARGFRVEDTVAIALRFASGALGTFILSDVAASSRSWEQTSGENKAYPNFADDDCYLVAGDRGSLYVPTLRVRAFEGERSWWAPMTTHIASVERSDPLALQLAHFCAVVRREAEPLVSARDACETLRITLKIAEKAQIT